VGYKCEIGVLFKGVDTEENICYTLNMKEEFCLNSKRWINLMALKGQPPKTCPKRKDNFLTCEYCAYYQMREKSKYLKNIYNHIKNIYES